MVEQKRIGLDSMIAQFQDLKDPRCQVKLKHPLISVVVLCLLAVARHIEQQLEQNLPVRQHETIDIGHGREEQRQYDQMPVPKTLPGFENSNGLKTIGVVFHSCARQEKETLEARYEISSIPAKNASS